MEEKIVFDTDDGQIELYVIEETRVSGENYLLVTDSDEEEAECYIMHDTSDPEDSEAAYEFVEDEELLAALEPIFAELLGEDVDLS